MLLWTRPDGPLPFDGSYQSIHCEYCPASRLPEDQRQQYRAHCHVNGNSRCPNLEYFATHQPEKPSEEPKPEPKRHKYFRPPTFVDGPRLHLNKVRD